MMMITDDILNELTLDEKIRLLNGVGSWHTYDCNGKLPVIMMTDGPHGLRKVVNEKAGDINDSMKATCFPTASAIASSWNPEVAAKMAAAIAMEAKKEDVSIVLGCGTNMKRSPLCGRNFEYFSEDPLLAGRMGIAYVKEMQAEGIGTSVKHFAANSQETRRQTSNSEVDERALREIYLRAFEMIVKEAQPITIMASYNRLNGDYACANKHLLTDILRDEWGYNGAVISDWGATVDAVKCITAGMSLEMPDDSGYHERKIKEAIESGEITEEDINRAAAEVIENVVYVSESLTDYEQRVTANGFNCMDEGNSCEDEPSSPTSAFIAANKIAREIENECAVLLKNDGILPLSSGRKIIAIGELAEKMRFQGGGSSHINASCVMSAVDALKHEGLEVKYLKGYSCDTVKRDKALEQEVIECLRNTDDKDTIILFFIGLTDSIEGEGFDRKDLNIAANQTDLLNIVAENTKLPIAAVSFGGAAMDYSWDDKVCALLHMHLGGQAVGESVADLLTGKVCPSGRLSESIPYSIEDTPAYRYFGRDCDDVEYRESLFIGYRYYETYNVPVKYPFGYGLSYSTFEYSNIRISKSEIPTVASLARVKDMPMLTVSFTVKNVGKYDSYAVPQIYVCNPEGDFIRSKRELAGFDKVFVRSGEEIEVSVPIMVRCFSVYDVEKGDFAVIGGKYGIVVAESVKSDKLAAEVVIEGVQYSRNERELFPDYFKPQKHGMEIERAQFERLYGKSLSDYAHRKKGDYDLSCSFADVCGRSVFGKMFSAVIKLALAFMCRGKKKDDPARIMMIRGVEEGSLESLIANSGGMLPPKLFYLLVDKANK